MSVILILTPILVSAFIWQYQEIIALQKSVNKLRTDFIVLTNTASTTAAAASTTESLSELANREQLVQKSKDQQLQDVVAAATPAVVSIVESKEVPRLQVTYQNPFGNDPFFQGFGMQFPFIKRLAQQRRTLLPAQASLSIAMVTL